MYLSKLNLSFSKSIERVLASKGVVKAGNMPFKLTNLGVFVAIMTEAHANARVE